MRPTTQHLNTQHHTSMAPASTKMEPMSDGKYAILLALIGAHSLVGGYYAATRPEGAGWRLFSWHPMLMLCGKTSN